MVSVTENVLCFTVERSGSDYADKIPSNEIVGLSSGLLSRIYPSALTFFPGRIRLACVESDRRQASCLQELWKYRGQSKSLQTDAVTRDKMIKDKPIGDCLLTATFCDTAPHSLVYFETQLCQCAWLASTTS